MKEVFRITCGLQHYHWGKLGEDSKVYQLIKDELAENEKDLEKKHFAELWMGTHQSGSSYLYNDKKVSLKEYILANPEEALGEGVLNKFGQDLPFLYKILSVNAALSIQAHPGKKLAEKLHKSRPEVYKDDNHKPEMSIALTDFEAMSGFRSLEEIVEFLRKHPSFYELVGKEKAERFIQISSEKEASESEKRQVLREIFTKAMKTEKTQVEQRVHELLEETRGGSNVKGSMDELVHRLFSQYGNDIGLFCPFFLNVLQLKPGEAFFMGADEPHAYISGDCVECMATSDNVVRAGLTPKFRDVDVLVDMLTYEYGPGEDKLTKGAKWANHSLLYNPPIDEFAVVQTKLRKNECEKLTFDGPAVIIVTTGSGTIGLANENSASQQTARTGSAFFASANTEFCLNAESDDFLAYTAFTSV
ncbi:Mannose-6-phosphate isomerase [Zancudomyces culisetae]|uniref:Mannose-6-phosphate isomerase n=1 Tax=Zancudomyces culisetae TaxID=1213189 RepID=A0A1R1PTJ9_ZANCU|nr:Mannose-6-phosphate isomerase [Zancudomyces culisetae]|eukprot:OMH84288.1 Mannose-6-phosphate isomerase [Zancudomyces culisetae]